MSFALSNDSIGIFRIEHPMTLGPIIRVGDPFFINEEPEIQRSKVALTKRYAVKQGGYRAMSVSRDLGGIWGNRYMNLLLIEDNLLMAIEQNNHSIEFAEDGWLGVDSGRIGILDDTCSHLLFENEPTPILEEKYIFITSCLGDGIYKTFTARNENSEIVGIYIDMYPNYHGDQADDTFFPKIKSPFI